MAKNVRLGLGVSGKRRMADRGKHKVYDFFFSEHRLFSILSNTALFLLSHGTCRPFKCSSYDQMSFALTHKAMLFMSFALTHRTMLFMSTLQ